MLIHTMGVFLNFMSISKCCFLFSSKLHFKMSTDAFLGHCMFWHLAKHFFSLSESNPLQGIYCLYGVTFACLCTPLIAELNL